MMKGQMNNSAKQPVLSKEEELELAVFPDEGFEEDEDLINLAATTAQKKVAARRRVEHYLEMKRLREEIGEYDLEMDF